MGKSRSRAALVLHGLMVLCVGGSQALAAPADPPYPADIYVRGSFNGWDLGHPMAFDTKANRYVAVVELGPSGPYQFKIASEDWLAVDLGSPAAFPGNVVELDVPEPLATTPGYGNMFLTVDEPGVYSFTLDPTNATNPTVTVAYARAGGDGAQHWGRTYFQSWYFDCLGDWVTAELTQKATLHERFNPGGGLLYSENIQVTGTAWDSNNNLYSVNGSWPLRYSAPPSGGFQFDAATKLAMVSQGSSPNLLLHTIYKLHVDADGNVVREFIFDAFGCSQ
jgi:hypothetical protein